jgi:hypothetical protein
MNSRAITDEQLLEQFESASMPEDCFHHPEHVRTAFLYLCRFPMLEALQRFSAALRRFAVAKGKPDRYHETITWAYMFLVKQRMETSGQIWEEFASANADLFDWRNSLLKKYYREDTLSSEKARRQFVLPDKNL